MPQTFDGNVVLDDAASTPAAPSTFFGFVAANAGASSTGPRIYGGTGQPNGVLSSIPGSLYLSMDGSAGGGGTLFVNSTVGTGTTWVLASATT